jgi:hypothetical protein
MNANDPHIPQPSEPPTTPWLSRPSTIRLLWIVASVLLALTVLAQVFVPLYAHFGVDGWFGFNAAYGFLSCVAMVLFAKLLGVLLKRPDDYYESRAAQEERKDV